MANELVTQQANAVATLKQEDIVNVQRLGNILAASGYFADAREMAQAAVKVMAGQELGLPPIASMMGINIIKGKVSLGVHLIASRVKAHGYDYRFKRHDNQGCTLEFFSRPEGGKRISLGESSFDESDAKAAGIFSDMYKKYPKNMYYSRAMSNGAKFFCPDVFAGAPVYTPEELGAEVDAYGEIVQPSAQEQQRTIVETKTSTPPAKPAQAASEPTPPTTQSPYSNGKPEHSAAVMALYERCKKAGKPDRFAAAQVVGGLKKDIEEDSGNTHAYYEVLAEFGMEHASPDTFKGVKASTVASLVRALYERHQAIREALVEPEAEEQSELDGRPDSHLEDRGDWLPSNLGGTE